MFIQVQETPNPNVLKFIPPEFKISKDYFFENIESAQKKSPLAYVLFQIDGINNVFLSDGFISVGKTDLFDWSLLRPIVINFIMEFIANNKTVIFDEEDDGENNNEINLKEQFPHLKDDDCPEIIEQIKEIIEERVRPSVKMDGGDITYVAFQEGVLFLQLQGACSGCPSASLTLKAGIRNLLQYYIPEVVDVVDVMDLVNSNN